MSNKNNVPAIGNHSPSPKFPERFLDDKLELQKGLKRSSKKYACNVLVQLMVKCNKSSINCKQLLRMDIDNFHSLKTQQKVPLVLSGPLPLPQNFLTVSQLLESTKGPPLPVTAHYDSKCNDLKSVLNTQTLIAFLIFHGSGKSSVRFSHGSFWL